MSVSVVDRQPGAPGHIGTSPDESRTASSRPRREHSGLFGVRAGQVVATQAAVALLIAALGHGPLAVVGAALAATVLVLTAWVRLRQRWLFEWLAVGTRYLGRRHSLPPTTEPAALLELVAPDAQVHPADLGGDTAAVVTDAHGLTALLELGDPATVLADAPEPLPSPASLLPAASADLPPVRIQLLLSGAPAPALRAGGATPGNSYRQLSDGRLLAQARAVLAVRVLRADGWTDHDLRRALSSLVRKVRRRLGTIPARPLGEGAVLRVLGELAHHDGAHPARESWHAVQLGGLLQSTFRLRRWPDLRSETARRLVPRVLGLPAAATTLSISAGPRAASTDAVAVDLTVRLAAADPGTLSGAAQALRRLLATEGAEARRLDGEHLDGFATTLPLAAGGPGPLPTLTAGPVMAAATLDTLDLTLAGAGLMIGANRHGAPVTARLFRAETTRGMLIGGVRGAQLIALRAMALGARIVVQTARPRAWEPFIRGVSAPGESIAVIPPGRAVGGPPGTPLHPLLVVVDVGPVAADSQPGPGWQATLVVRDELAPVDIDAVSRADLVVLQPLRPEEAALAGSALGLGDAAEWLTRIQDDMVGVISRRTVRWALLSTTPIESQLIGAPTRH